VTERLVATDQTAVANTAAEAAALLADTSAKWGEVAKRIGLRLD
jgi:hypothetical protein